MKVGTRSDGIVRTTAGALLVASLALPVEAQVTARVSVTSSGTQGQGGSEEPSISGDGRYVAFESSSPDLVPGDGNIISDIFVRDRFIGTTQRVSVDPGGASGNSDSRSPSISSDGRYVAFHSQASNLVAGDSNGHPDVFVRDRLSGTTERVSVDSGLTQGNNYSNVPSVSDDGRFVAFASNASNLVAGDTNGFLDVFVRDRLAGTTERVSVDSNGGQADHISNLPSISSDGRFVAFHSMASNLVGGDSNGAEDVFVRDRLMGTTERVSVDSGGAQANGTCQAPSISSDGRYVAFRSEASNLVAGDTNGATDVFVRDRLMGTTARASVGAGGVQGTGPSYFPSVSDDGRFVAFNSPASNLVSGDTNGVEDIFVRDRQAGTTERVSVDSAGAQVAANSWWASIAGDGSCVAFYSFSSSLVPGDTNGSTDVFVHERSGGPDFTSLCEPGVGGVIACPCSNPPTGPGRGCDNSSATGGASLTASGGTYLSSDSLVFTTSGEKPTALSIVGQWNNTVASGVTFGQGVRCTAGTLKRLFSQNAVAGSITVPNFGAGDPSVSARSAAKGDTILAGSSRWYLVYYRDNTVLGGCPPLANFNSTQTGRVTWSP